MTQSHRLPEGGIVDRSRPASLRLRRRAVRRLRRRHRRLGAPRERHPPSCPQLQVPPAARHPHRRRRGAQRIAADRRGRALRAQRARDGPASLRRTDRGEPESLAVASLRRRCRQRRGVAAHSGGLLLQDVHVAADAEGMDALRARNPPRCRHGPRRERARSGSLRASVRALRRARRRRRPGGTCRRARRGARGGARDPLRRECLVRREPSRRGRVHRRRARGSVDRSDDDRARRACRASCCCRVPLHSATTTATSSDCASASPMRVRNAARRRASACGKCAPKPSSLAAGAHERGIAYANNDLPGTLLAGAARRYVEALRCVPDRGQWSSRTTTARTVRHWRSRARVSTVASIIDARPDAAIHGELPRKARETGMRFVAGAAIARAHGRRHVSAVDVVPLSGGATRRVECDLVCVSGGWNPAVHLFSQARGRLRYDAPLATFVPDGSPLPIAPAGAANGRFDLAAALADGHAAGCAAAAQAGLTVASVAIAPPSATSIAAGALQPVWRVAPRRKGDKCFVDLQNDVTVADVALAAREGYRSVEHLKRYTTLGMGTDQGKLANIVGIALLAEEVGQPIAAGRHDDVSTAVFAGDTRRVSGPRSRSGRRADALQCDARLARRARRAIRQRRTVEAPALVSARRRIAGRRGEPGGKKRTHERRSRRRIDARQDRAARARRGGIPEPRLHQSLGHARGGPLPLRRHAARRRHGARRRDDVAGSARPTI